MDEGIYAIIDTNALLLPFTDNTDVERELERLFGAVRMVIPSSVVQELNGLSQGGDGKVARAAKAAQRLMQRYRIEPTGLPGDDGVLEAARRLKGVVVTNDRNVQREAKHSGLEVVASRGRGRLGIAR